MFYPLKSDTGAVLPFEQQPAAAGTYAPGTTLVFSEGKLIVAHNPSAAPHYVSVGHETVADGGMITVVRCAKDVVWRCDDVVGTPKLGDKLGVANGVQASSEVSKIMLVIGVRDDGSIEVRF